MISNVRDFLIAMFIYKSGPGPMDKVGSWVFPHHRHSCFLHVTWTQNLLSHPPANKRALIDHIESDRFELNKSKASILTMSGPSGKSDMFACADLIWFPSTILLHFLKLLWIQPWDTAIFHHRCWISAAFGNGNATPNRHGTWQPRRLWTRQWRARLLTKSEGSHVPTVRDPRQDHRPPVKSHSCPFPCRWIGHSDRHGWNTEDYTNDLPWSTWLNESISNIQKHLYFVCGSYKRKSHTAYKKYINTEYYSISMLQFTSSYVNN